MYKRQLLDLEGKIERQIERKIVAARHQIEVLAERLDGVSPLKRLGKGYAYVTDKKGQPLKIVEQVEEGDPITVQVTDGKIVAYVQQITLSKQ